MVHPLHGKLGEAGKLANFRSNCKRRKHKMIPQDFPFSSTGESIRGGLGGGGVPRWNSWTPCFVEVSGHKLEASQTGVFVWFSTLILTFYKMLFMNRLEFCCFAKKIFVRIFKTRKEYGFLKNPSVEGTVNSMEQKTLVEQISKNSIQSQKVDVPRCPIYIKALRKRYCCTNAAPKL
jgi:hypothetical protein